MLYIEPICIWFRQSHGRHSLAAAQEKPARQTSGREVVQHALSFPMERHGIYILQALVPSRCILYTPTYLSQDVIGCTQLYLYCRCSHSLRWKPGVCYVLASTSKPRTILTRHCPLPAPLSHCLLRFLSSFLCLSEFFCHEFD